MDIMMKIIPQQMLKQFDAQMISRKIPPGLHGYYRKWLRFYLDFCEKYGLDTKNPDSLPEYIAKLREKKQSSDFQKQAYHSILVYFETLGIRPGWLDSPPMEVHENKSIYVQKPEDEYINTWKPAYEKMSNEVKVRHYSPKTYKAYSTWVRKFQSFLKSKPIDQLIVDDVKVFLTHLAVDQNVSASSQNQAFNALLFFFRYSLGKEFGKVDGVVRAKRKPYIPVVLSRTEVDLIRYPYDLAVKLLYGCGSFDHR